MAGSLTDAGLGWGSALAHHPHVHVIVPGSGLAPDGARWIARKPGFFLPVRVLSRLFRRLFLEGLAALLRLFRRLFLEGLEPCIQPAALPSSATSRPSPTSAPSTPRSRRSQWVIFVKRPFAGSQAVLAYLARYTHRVPTSNSPLIAIDDKGATFKWKDYCIKGRDRLADRPHRIFTFGDIPVAVARPDTCSCPPDELPVDVI